MTNNKVTIAAEDLPAQGRQHTETSTTSGSARMPQSPPFFGQLSTNGDDELCHAHTQEGTR
jgi:hypothetical protein